ncbi:hypothetical protein Efla_000920 [Eimeria flavescens]
MIMQVAGIRALVSSLSSMNITARDGPREQQLLLLLLLLQLLAWRQARERACCNTHYQPLEAERPLIAAVKWRREQQQQATRGIGSRCCRLPTQGWLPLLQAPRSNQQRRASQCVFWAFAIDTRTPARVHSTSEALQLQQQQQQQRQQQQQQQRRLVQPIEHVRPAAATAAAGRAARKGLRRGLSCEHVGRQQQLLQQNSSSSNSNNSSTNGSSNGRQADTNMANGEKRMRSSFAAFAALHSLLLLLLLLQEQQVVAFEAAAHEAISMTALSGLTLQANQALRRLLNGKDVADVSGWAHRVTEKYPLTAPLHFQRQPRCQSPPPAAANTKIERSLCSSSDAADKGCLLEALTYFFFKLTAPDKNKEIRDDANPVINTSQFVFPHGISTTDADAWSVSTASQERVKYVINLIGDMHEPLHWGSADDDFGRAIQGMWAYDSLRMGCWAKEGKNILFAPAVEYEVGDAAREVRRTSLYQFIEGAFVQKIMKERQAFWYSGWTHVNSVKSFYEEEKVVFAARKESYFLSWARENRALLCSEIYPLLSRMAKKKGESNVYILDRTAEFLFFEIIKRRILVAGARVAVVMNHILQVRGLDEGLGQLRAGSGMQDVQETADVRLPSSGDSCMYTALSDWQSPEQLRHRNCIHLQVLTAEADTGLSVVHAMNSRSPLKNLHSKKLVFPRISAAADSPP